MGKMRKKWNPFWYYEFEYLESYLEDKARDGLILKEAGRTILTFEEGEPREMKFRLLPDLGWIKDDEKDFYEESGWRYVGNDRMPLLANDDADAEELFTDGASFKSRAKDFQSNTRWLISFSFIWIIYFAFRIYQDIKNPGLLHSYEDSNLGLWAFGGITAVWFIAFQLFKIVTASKVVKRIQRCEKLRRNINKAEYGRRIRINKIFLGSAVLIIVLSMIILFAPFDSFPFDEDLDISDNKTKHPVSMQSFDPKGYVEVKNAIASGKDEEDDAGYKRATWDSKVFIGVWNDQGWSYNNDNDKYDVYYYACIYKARSESKAERYLKEEIFNALDGKSPEDIELKGYGIDYVGYGKDEDGDPRLYLRDGSKLETVNYSGEVDLKSKIDLFIEDIKTLE